MNRVHPEGPFPPSQRITHTPNHWCTHETLLAMMDQIDKVMNPGGEQTPWCCLLDCAPQHIAAKWRQQMAEERPWVILADVERTYTGDTQPFDLAYMKTFKGALQRRAGKHFARYILASMSPSQFGPEDLKLGVASSGLLSVRRESGKRKQE